MPKSVQLRLDGIQRPHLVKCKTVCLSKKPDGLCVKCLSVLNKALLCKWIWCFSKESSYLWRKIIEHKFGVGLGGGVYVKSELVMGVFGRVLKGAGTVFGVGGIGRWH